MAPRNRQKDLFERNAVDQALEVVGFLKREVEYLRSVLKEEAAKAVKLQKKLDETEERISVMRQERLFKGEVFDEIKDLIGEEPANLIVGYFAGSNIYVPKSVVTQERYRCIRKEFKSGATYLELATKYGYTETHIRRIVHRRGKNK
jgi:hypothetical protein